MFFFSECLGRSQSSPSHPPNRAAPRAPQNQHRIWNRTVTPKAGEGPAVNTKWERDRPGRAGPACRPFLSRVGPNPPGSQACHTQYSLVTLFGAGPLITSDTNSTLGWDKRTQTGGSTFREFTGKWAGQGMNPGFQSKAESAQCPEGAGG